MIRNPTAIVALAAALSTASQAESQARAEDVAFEIEAERVQCQGSAAYALQAILRAAPTASIEADPANRSLVARFDEREVDLDSIVAALEEAGIPVDGTRRLSDDPKESR